MPEIRKPYDESNRTHPDPGGPSRTKQSFKDAADINNVVRQYAQTGVISNVTRREPIYGDFSEVADLQQSLERVQAAQAEFDALHPEIRFAAQNDPVQFLNMMASEEGVKALRAAGMIFEGEDPRQAAIEAREAEEAEARTDVPDAPSEPDQGEGPAR